MKAVLYVSRALLSPIDTDRVIGRLVREARLRNESLEIRGALIFTGDHFAQLLEGPPQNIDEVMHSISRDSRHHSLRIFGDQPVSRWLPPRWGLAFSGRSTYVDRHIRPLFAIGHNDLPGARAELMDLLQGLASSARD